jgi:hypothetical protein
MADPATILSDRRAPIVLPDTARIDGFDGVVRKMFLFWFGPEKSAHIFVSPP